MKSKQLGCVKIFSFIMEVWHADDSLWQVYHNPLFRPLLLVPYLYVFEYDGMDFSLRIHDTWYVHSYDCTV